LGVVAMPHVKDLQRRQGKVIITAIEIDKDQEFGIEAYKINQPLVKGEPITLDFTVGNKPD